MEIIGWKFFTCIYIKKACSYVNLKKIKTVVKYGKYSPVKLANFEYFSITRGIAQISITCVTGIQDFLITFS